MTHNKYLNPLLNLLNDCISAKSIPQILSLNEEYTFLFLNFLVTGVMEDLGDKLDIFNNLVTECKDRHAPLKRTKCTRPQVPCLKSLDIQQLISERNCKRYLAHLTPKTSDWTAYRAVRNKLKYAIRTTKKNVLTSALSDKRPRSIWRFIHRILKPKNQTITVNADDLNKHFIATANRLLKSEYLEPQDILKTLESLPDQTSKANFNLQYVTYEQVEKELKNLRLDCSAGYDNISGQHVKSFYESLVSPLTHIINSSISENYFQYNGEKRRSAQFQNQMTHRILMTIVQSQIDHCFQRYMNDLLPNNYVHS